jgi:hypothetical protein
MISDSREMTVDDRKTVVINYLKAFDNGGITIEGGKIIDMFAEDARVFFPKWGVATGKLQIERMFSDVGATLKSITHHYDTFNWVTSNNDLIVCEGTSHGEHVDGPWKAGSPPWGAGNWCDVFEIRHWRITRLYIYLDPDYAGGDKARYQWLTDA